MSLTIQQIITDAKRLATRLKERDSVADVLLNETNVINKRIDAMKQFQDDVEQLNEVAHQKPHSQLIANIQRDNRHFREIQQENKELRAALEEYQITLEHVMFKYRQHTTAQIYNTKVDFQSLQMKEYDEIIRKQAEKIQEMAAVMYKAASIDEKRVSEDEKIMSMLRTENKGLRELLQIATKFGSLNKNKTEDKHVQTDLHLYEFPDKTTEL